MERPKQIILYGVIIWLFPFVLSVLFYRPDGTLTISLLFFKTIMIVVGSFIGVCMAVKYFRQVKNDYLNAGITIGLAWFMISIVLDLAVLVPMSGMTIVPYFMEIGLRYLVIPMITVGMGYVLEGKK
ncbi:MAG: hypothetical protein KAS90_02190 [Candidatus Aenigmarchaeota archaeon]|nr:hypothetical protein [Candidatus Aenigmarchaeota archaeon]